MNAHLEGLFSELPIKRSQLSKNVILWKEEHTPESYASFRLSEEEAHKREVDDLPPEEVANGIREVLLNQISLPKSDLLRETSRLLASGVMGYRDTCGSCSPSFMNGLVDGTCHK